MVMNNEDLIKRDSERDVWKETLDAVRSIKAGNVGHMETVSIPPVVEARQKVGLSQSRFAELLGVSVRTLQDWEQGRRNPSRAAKSLIQIANLRPEVLREVLAEKSRLIGIGSYSSSPLPQHQWHSVKNRAHSVKDLMDF